MVFYAVSALLAFAGASRAAAECDNYTVMPGDTLRLIAERYYGAREFSPIIYEANIAVVGEDPNIIEIGMELAIPCREGIQMPLPSAFLAQVGPALPADSTPRFLARAGATPFINLDGTGIIPDILGAALRKGGYRAELGLARLDSSARILQVSRSDATALLSFPWIKPECDRPDTLTAASLDLCQNYELSDPLFEITLGLFTRSDDALVNATMPADFTDKSFCIPQFHSDDLLRRTGISPLRGELTLSTSFDSCINGLLTGTYDVVVADYQSFNTYYTAKPAMLTDIPPFARQTTLHAAAYRENPAALQILTFANTGLGRIMASGEWFSIVNQSLSPRIN